jgi:hypothetical protein
MSKLSAYVALAASSVPLGAGAYVARRMGAIQAWRLQRGAAFGVAYLFGVGAAGALSVWALDPAWGWLREIIAPLGGAVAGCIGVAILGHTNANGSSQGARRTGR